MAYNLTKIKEEYDLSEDEIKAEHISENEDAEEFSETDYEKTSSNKIISKPVKSWRKSRKFLCTKKAVAFVKDLKCWKKIRSYNSREGVKEYYRCIRGSYRNLECSAGLYLLYHSDSNIVSLFETGNHSNHKDQGRGIKKSVRTVIEQLFENGINTPKAILNYLRYNDIVEPKQIQLKNFLCMLRNKKSTASADESIESYDDKNLSSEEIDRHLSYDGNVSEDDHDQDTTPHEYDYSPTSCRTCFKEGDIPIFGTNDISNDINEFGRINVTQDDGYPQYLCQACKSLLESAIEFLNTAQTSDQILKSKVRSAVNNKNIELPSGENVQEEYIEFKDSSDSENDVDSLKLQYDSDDEGEEKNYDTNIETKLFQKSDDNEIISDADNEMIMIVVSDKDKGNTVCEKCNITFDTITELESHNSEFHSSTSSKEKECGVCHKLVSFNMYKDHIEQHRDKYQNKKDRLYGKIECEVCHKTINKTYYKYHKKMHGTTEEKAEREIECPVCKKKFSSFYFPDHMKRMHYGIKSKKTDRLKELVSLKKCPVCDKSIKESIFKEHLEKHGGSKKEYICDKCGRVFKYPSAFKTHRLTHGSELKYKCEFCPYRGLHQALLKIHVRTHTGDYNYKCTECPAKFITKSNLSKHLQRHAKIYNFQCDKCNKPFYTKRDVLKHDKVVHSEKKDIVCGLCGKAFSHRDSLVSHERKVHKREKIREKIGQIPSYLKAKLRSEENDDEVKVDEQDLETG